MRMHRWRFAGCLCFAAISVATSNSSAQTRAAAKSQAAANQAPVIISIRPPHARIGATSEWALSGRNLSAVERWLFSGAGIEVVEAKAKSDSDLQLKVKVADDAEPGYRELRAVAAGGVSNLALVRVDRLEIGGEVEPNNAIEHATPIRVEAAIAGVLKPQDRDYYRFSARAGDRLTIDVDARRLGTPLSPVATVLTPSGAALVQSHENRAVDYDARASFVVPADGDYVIELRDNVYAGGDQAQYILRVARTKFATALFPLGGVKGSTITVTASGGSLESGVNKTITLPENPGTIFDPGAFDAGGELIESPGKVVIGDGTELVENAADEQGQSTTALPMATTANGRIARAGEVDRYTVAVKKGEAIGLRVQASDLGSWLDSVLTLRDEKGNVLAENDDPPNASAPGNPLAGSIPPPDSRLNYVPQADGTLVVEIADRYGDGGPEYGYRLELGAAHAEFAVSILLGNLNPNQRGVVVQRRQGQANAAALGAFNLKPGSQTSVNFIVSVDGETGPIELKAEGLPSGVTAAPVTVRPPAIPAGSKRRQAQPPLAGAIILIAGLDASTDVGQLRVVATATPKTGPPITRAASLSLPVDNPLPGNLPTKPVTRIVSAVPVKVIGAAATPTVAIATSPAAFGLRSVTIPGVLLQGSKLEIALGFEPAGALPKGLEIEARVKGAGLSAQAVVAEASELAASAEKPAALVRVISAVDAEPGTRDVVVTIKPTGGEAFSRTIPIVVRRPFTVRVPRKDVALAPGDEADVFVAIEREPGFDGAVELRFDLPEGVRATSPLTISPNEHGKTIRLRRDPGGKPLTDDSEVRVAAVARMIRGRVRVVAADRPLIRSSNAEKEGRRDRIVPTRRASGR